MVWKNNMARRRITSIATWTSAFFFFASIYLAAHPQRVQGILKYGYIVRTAAARYSGWGWRDYDRTVQIEAAINASEILVIN